ncbi:hypothetical protein J6590_036809, partial [Homalodisca vitripennis]
RLYIPAILLWLQTSDGRLEIIVTSAYFPRDGNVMSVSSVKHQSSSCPRILEDREYLIIRCDANAHHLVWRSTNANSRVMCLNILQY